MKKVFILVLTLFILIFPRVVHAADSEQITSYGVNIAVVTDGTINVEEKIQYLFPSPRHGIFRDIPVIKTNADGKKFQITLSDVSVTDDSGAPYTFTSAMIGDNEEFKIGDADRTITGSHWYVIAYKVSGALTYFPGHDELYWNSVGNQWQVPISAAETTVTLPKAVARADLNAKCDVCTISYTDTSVTFKATGQLNPYEGMTIVVGFPKGMVVELNPNEVVPFFTTLAGKITLVLIGIAAFLWYIVAPILIVRNWWKYGRDPKPAMGVVSAWFSPPRTKNLRDLTPAETGSLVDETVDTRDIYATVVDLARRGYMKIIESKDKKLSFEKQKDWKGDSDIQPFESELLTGIFGGKKKVDLEDLNLIETFRKIKGQLYDSLVSDGFFDKNPQATRTLYYVLAFFAFITGNLILLIVAVTFGRNMPRKTQFGAQAAAMGKSLKNFLVSQERHLKFQAQKQMMFEKLLPFAVAFGVEEIWAKRFKDLGLKQPDWYVSPYGGTFNSVVFAQSIGHAASVSFASSIASKSSTGFSSGFGGGGFSGGGGGGGGGGSW